MQAAHEEQDRVSGLRTSARAGLSGAAAVAAFLGGGAAGLAAALLSLLFAAAGMPLFRRYAMARPNARSSHATPVPQGGGAAVVLATVAVALWSAAVAGGTDLGRLGWIAAAALVLAATGAADDIRNLAVRPRLALQFAAVAAVVAAGMAGGRILPFLPAPAEAALLVVAGVWFVNLTNFMDGIDGITLAGFMPLAGGAAVLSWMGYATPAGGLLAAAFFGALAGFVWFNLPRAGLFLGDVGSLPIGLLGGALLLDLAQNGALAAAVILPLYHFADATLTLLRRLARREKVWEAHRQHAYQRAVDGGWSHARASGLVLVLNLGLAALALASARFGIAGQVGCVAAATAAVGVVLVALHRTGRPR